MFEELNNRRKAVEENIAKSFGVDVDLEKARYGTYSDTAENRRLNRVGLKYGETKNTFKTGTNVKVIINGETVVAKYKQPHSYDDKHTVEYNGKMYSVSEENIEKIAGQNKRKSISFNEAAKMQDKLDEIKFKISDLKEERKQVEIDMEEELGQLSQEEISDGNNPLVVHYGKELDRIDNEISRLQTKYKKQRETLKKYDW